MTAAGEPAPLPEGLAARPRDVRRGLPIPPVSLHPDPVTGSEDVLVDFTTVNTATSTRLAADRLCSLCGQHIGYWVAFIGGTRAAELMRYTDPPTCPPCAHAAIRLCPYIAVGRHRRARADRPGAGIVPPGASPTNPTRG